MCIYTPYNTFKMLSIGQFLELYPELKGLDRNIQMLAYECYIEDSSFDVDEFLINIR